MKKINIGLIGYRFMGRTHSNAFRQAPVFFKHGHQPVLKAVCGRNAEQAQAFAQNWGYESVETDWRKLIARSDIDLIDIATPNNLHFEMAIEAAKAGKMVMCEKPLAMNAAEAEQMVSAVEKAKVPNMVWYNYRRVPAVTLAKQLIDQGKLGKIFHYRAKFLQDWTINADVPQGGTGTWRLDASVSGSGVTGDLLAHCIDTAMWLNGGIDTVTAATETFVKERKHAVTGKMQEVKIDDARPCGTPLWRAIASSKASDATSCSASACRATSSVRRATNSVGWLPPHSPHTPSHTGISAAHFRHGTRRLAPHEGLRQNFFVRSLVIEPQALHCPSCSRPSIAPEAGGTD